jgi:trehalose 6-phosphate phosphatase
MSQLLFDAIHHVEQQVMQAGHVLLCLDYDGTLTHFTASPVGAHLSPQMERVLLSLAEQEMASLAIVSGRNRADLQARVGIAGLIYVGNHGLEISGPGFLFVEPTAASHVGALQELADQLTKMVEPITGAVVENKGLTISVHYRLVPPGLWDEVRRVVHDALARTTHPFVLTTGEKIFEIRPRVYWNKGSAVCWIKERLGKPDVLPIYVGDDTTDEDAFVALPDGITIKVGEAGETAARYLLDGPAEVRKFLEWFDDTLRHKAFRHAESFGGGAGQEAALGSP